MMTSAVAVEIIAPGIPFGRHSGQSYFHFCVGCEMIQLRTR